MMMMMINNTSRRYAAGERSSLWHVGTLAGTQSTQGSEARVETLLESTSNLLA